MDELNFKLIVKCRSSQMSLSANKRIKYTETIEHQGLEALTGVPVQNYYQVLKKIKCNINN